MQKIGHGHEFVIVARKTGAPDLYFTKGRCWVSEPANARLFPRASDAYKVSAGPLQGYTITREGIYCAAFGHEG